MRYVKINIGMPAAEEAVHAGYGGGTVHIIIAKDQYFFTGIKSPEDACNGQLHILHQEGIMQVGQGRTEKILGLLIGINTALHQDVAEYRMDLQIPEQHARFIPLLGDHLPSFLRLHGAS